ncbi:hypothetical protein [Priestia aryabhattai]
MRKLLGYLSIIVFALSAILWVVWFNEIGTIFSVRVDFIVAITLAVIGMLTAFFAKNNTLAVTSFIGNLAIIFLAVVFPFLMSLIWKPIP